MSISWYPLAEADPVPGDPWIVTQGGLHYQAVADAIQGASANLTEIASLAGMTSSAVVEIRDKAVKVSAEIGKVQRRYSEVSAALTAYAGSLTTAQTDSADLLRRARLAQERIDDAGTADYRANAALDIAAPEDQQARQADVLSARSESRSASAALVTLRGDLEVVKQSRDSAAQTAIDSIGDVVGSDELNDGWWEDWGSKVASVVSDVAGVISTVAGIAALVLAWVPVLGAALAAVALIAGAIKLIADVALLAHGEGSWLDVGLGVLGLATFGLGRLAGTTFKVANRASVGLSRIRAGQMASKMGNARAAITQLVGPKVGAITRTAAVKMSRPLTDSGRLARDVGKAVGQNPLSELKGGFRMLTDRAFAAEQWSAGRAAFQGLSGPKSWLLATQGHAAAAQSGQLMAGVSRGVIDSSAALSGAMRTSALSAGGIAVLTADGIRSGVDGVGSLFELVTDAFGPSTAQQLNLTQ
ncbi:MAG: hypothetical protein ACOH2F_14040 [Cellulomonas sp.]